MESVRLVNVLIYQMAISFNCLLIYAKGWINKLDCELLSMSNIVRH